MKIKILFGRKSYRIEVNENDTFEDLKEKCVKKIIKKYLHKDHVFLFGLKASKLYKLDDKLIDFNIKENDTIIMRFIDHYGGGIDN